MLNYKTYKIKDICYLVKGEYPTLKTPLGQYPLVVTAEYRRTADTYQIDGEAVCIPLISSTGHGDAAIHRIHYQTGKFALANLLVALLPKESNLYFPKYLYYLFTAKKEEYFVTLMRGTSNVSLKEKDVAEVKIPLPPLEEQQRIVARIEKLAGKIEEVRRLREEALRESEALFLVNRAKMFEEYLQKLTILFDEVAILERGKFSHRPRNEPRFFGGKHPWIQIAEIESSGKYICDWTQTLNDEGLAISKKFAKGTLLISIAATIGAVGILNFDCCVPDSIVGIIPKSNISSEYLYHYLCYLRNNLEKIAPQSAQKNINLRILETLPIPKLSSQEQRRIVTYLDNLQTKIDEMKQLREQTIKELDALLPAILDKAFKGEL